MNPGPRNSYPSKKISVLLCFRGPSFLTGVLEGGLGVGYLGILETNHISVVHKVHELFNPESLKKR
jgi:hypothetical protein